MRFLVAILLSVLPAGQAAVAQTPRDELVGSWYFKRGYGTPCNTLINELQYYFHKDGKYSTSATMSDGSRHKYNGTYVATDSDATAFVDGRKIGPFPYTIRNQILRITQPDYRCDVELEREP